MFAMNSSSVVTTNNGSQWVSSSKGMIPPRGIVGGKNHHGPIYVARVKHDDLWIPGKLIPEYGKCYVSVEGQEHSSRSYEVLCGGILSWQKTTSQTPIPNIAITGGVDKLKAPLYIGRIVHGGSVTVGKVDSTTKKCYVLYGGVEHPYDTYELLINGNTGSTQATAYKRPVTGGNPTGSPKPVSESTLVPLEVNDKDYVNICNKMRASLPGANIIKIERVLNTTLWKRFMHCRERVMQENSNNANEKEFFHGSSVCQQIIQQGFDERHAKITGAFGAGVYFAEHASRSNQFTVVNPGGGKEMLLCRVILGNMSVGAGGQRAHAPPGYHSVCGNTTTSPEYVVYRGEQALPKFLITFT